MAHQAPNSIPRRILTAAAIVALLLTSATAAKAQIPTRQAGPSRIDLASLIPRFNGTWRVTRSVAAECPVQFAVFAIRINNGLVTTGGGTGTITGTGRVRFSGRDNSFRGFLSDKGTGSGTYSGRCVGTFTDVRTKP